MFYMQVSIVFKSLMKCDWYLYVLFFLVIVFYDTWVSYIHVSFSHTFSCSNLHMYQELFASTYMCVAHRSIFCLYAACTHCGHVGFLRPVFAGSMRFRSSLQHCTAALKHIKYISISYGYRKKCNLSQPEWIKIGSCIV